MTSEGDSTYFASKSKDEDCPFNINAEVSKRYSQLEKLFN